MATAVVVAAVVFALIFALFLAWPTIWDKITTATKVTETIDTSGDTSRPKTDTKVGDPASGLSSAEIGGIIAGGVAFLIGLIFFVRWLRRGSSETPEQKLKREKALAEPARRFRIVTAGKAGKGAASFVYRQAGIAGRFFAKATSATLEAQRKAILELKEELKTTKEAAVRAELEKHIEDQTDILIRNTEKWLARMPEEKFEKLEKWEPRASPAGESARGLPVGNAEPA